jgi:hypothetical protein
VRKYALGTVMCGVACGGGGGRQVLVWLSSRESVLKDYKPHHRAPPYRYAQPCYVLLTMTLACLIGHLQTGMPFRVQYIT